MSVKRNQKAMQIVWLALLLAMFAHTAVAFLFTSSEPPDTGQPMKTWFRISAAVLGIISLLIYGLSLSEKSLQKKFLGIKKDGEKKIDEFSNMLIVPTVGVMLKSGVWRI